MKKTILVVDDHPIVRAGLAGMLESGDDFIVAGLCADGEEALRFCRVNGMPDVVLMDIRMPKMDGFATLKALKAFSPDARVLMLAGMPMRKELEMARELGAAGYLSKNADQAALLDALRKILSGAIGFAEDGNAFSTVRGVLSERETQVLRLLAEGKTRDETAAALFLSSDTIRSHIKNIMKKLGAPNTASAIARAYESGILKSVF